MSYILDALRRADAERERGSVPGIHAQTTRSVPSRDAARSIVLPPWAWALVGMALVLMAWLVWRVTNTDPAGVPAPADRLAAAPAVTALAAPQPAPVVSSSGAATGAVTALSSPTSIAAPIPAPLPAPSRKRITPPPAPAVARALPVQPTDAAPAPAPAPAKPVTSADLKVFAIADLPEDIRRDLPKVSIGGSIYSENPASRFVMVNGQIFHEGDTLAPGVVLQQIKLRSAVLAFRGYRYGVSF